MWFKNLRADIKAANDANITSILYNPTQKALSGSVVPDYTAHNFQDVLKILQNVDKKISSNV